MPIKLRNLVVDRVDLVGKGDNPEAHIALFKRKDEKEDELPTWAQEMKDQVDKITKKVYGKEGDGKPMFDFKEYLKGLKDGELNDRIAKLAEAQQMTLGEAFEKIAEDGRTEVALKELVDKAFPPEKPAAGGGSEVDQLKARIKELEAQLAAKKSAPETPEDVLKALPENVRKMIEDSNERAEKAEKVAKEIKDEQQTAVYVAKAKEFSAILSAPDKVGPVLKRFAETNPTDYAVIEAVLKAGNEMLVRNNLMLKEVGTSSADSTAGTTESKIEAKAAKLMEADKTLTKAKAIAKVLKEDPSLYDEYQKENQEKENEEV